MKKMLFICLLFLQKGDQIKLIELYRSGDHQYYVPKLHELRGDLTDPGFLYGYKRRDSVYVTFELEDFWHTRKKYTVLRAKTNCSEKNRPALLEPSGCVLDSTDYLFSFSCSDTVFSTSFTLKEDEHIIITNGHNDHFMLDIN